MSKQFRSHTKMQSPGVSDVTWTDGFWAEKWRLLCDHMIPSQRAALNDPTNAAYFPNFAAAANLREHRRYFGVHWSDGDCYKYLEALSMIFAQTDDEAIDKELDEKIAMIAAAQESDGYLSTNIQLQELLRWDDTHNHELYNMGHLLTAASVHFTVTQKRSFLDVAIRLADYLYKTFQPRPSELAHFGWNPSNIMGAVDLYRATADDRYLELAGVFVDMRGSQPGGEDQNQDYSTLRQETRAVGHAVTGPYLYAGAADVYAETGDATLMDAIERIWDSATNRRMYITGGIGSNHYSATPRHLRTHESFGLDYELPNAAGYNETCANISLAMWGMRMGSLTGDAVYTDIVERVMYNAGISGVSVDGEHFCYTNPLRWYGDEHELLSNDAQGRWRTFPCYCCPPQVTRTMAHMHEWMYGVGDSSVWVHLYGGNKLNTTLPDGSTIALEQTTQFPWDGAVEIKIEEAPAGEMGLNLRIPEWADGAMVTVNGEAVSAEITPGTYLTLSRVWKAGDTIQLTLPMNVKLMGGHPHIEETRNHAAVMRGPVVYCLESLDLPDNVDLLDVYIAPDAELEAMHDADLLGGVTALDAKLVHRPTTSGDKLYAPLNTDGGESIETRLIPYYTWHNRGTPEMTVWLPVA